MGLLTGGAAALAGDGTEGKQICQLIRSTFAW